MIRTSTVKRILVYFLLLFPFLHCHSQLRYAIVGTYKGKSAQGMAIWQDKAYLFSHGGRCRIFNLKTEVVENEFMLGSADTANHVNCACFGNIVTKDNNIPLLYISECKNKRRCFVESVNDSSILLQTIYAKDEKGEIESALNWIVDRENSFLYSISRSSKDFKTSQTIHNYITKYRLPRLEEGEEIILGVEDRLERYDIPFVNILQGAKIYDGKLYVVTGLSQQRYEFSKNAERAIIVIDLKVKKIIKKISLTYVTTNEPEDIDFYNGKCLLYCGQNGGIYEINLNNL